MRICDKCGVKSDTFGDGQVIVYDYDPININVLRGVSPVHFDLCPKCYEVYRDFIDVSTVNWMQKKIAPQGEN